jgi:hypothetical protein
MPSIPMALKSSSLLLEEEFEAIAQVKMWKNTIGKDVWVYIVFQYENL